MLALVYALGAFLYLGVIGYALVLLLTGRRDEQAYLFSPAVGAAVIILLVMLPNYLGAPVKSFGLYLALSLAIMSAAFLAVRRPAFPPFLGLLLLIFSVGMLLTGRPFLSYGLNWLSYVNGDMNTYVFGATRILEHGYRLFPHPHMYVQNREAIQSVYSLDVLFDNRTGTENLIAAFMAATHFDGYAAYMPLMLATQLVLMSSAVALVYSRRRDKRVILAISLALSTSAMISLGTVYQLMPQVLGLTFLATMVGLFLVPTSGAKNFFGSGALAALPLAAFAVTYPETTPFLVLSLLTIIATRVLHRKIALADVLKWFATTASIAMVFLNFHVTTFLNELAITLFFGSSAGQARSTFVQFLVPSGLANLFGLIPMNIAEKEPLFSLMIACGLILLLVTVFASVVLASRAEPFACVALSFLIGGAFLAVHTNGFGLFKDAMYVQPFLIPTLIVWWAEASLLRSRDQSTT